MNSRNTIKIELDTKTISMKKIIYIIILLLFIIPGLAQDSVLILVSPAYKLHASNSQKFEVVSQNLSKLLKQKFKTLGYTCIDVNFQDWGDFSEENKIQKLKSEKARFAISTDKLVKLPSSNPAKSGYEVNIIIEHFNDDDELEVVDWPHSKFIVKGETNSYINPVAKSVSADIDYYLQSKPNYHFRPRFRIANFEMDPEDMDFDFDDFAKELKKLLRNHELYVFYYKEKYYPEDCDNLLTGELSGSGTGNSNTVSMVIMVKSVPADEEVEADKTFQIHITDFMPANQTKELVKEIEESITELKKNSNL